jgi:hypothetical protein
MLITVTNGNQNISGIYAASKLKKKTKKKKNQKRADDVSRICRVKISQIFWGTKPEKLDSLFPNNRSNLSLRVLSLKDVAVELISGISK